MDKYYYLASQLPFLKFKERARINGRDFLAESRKWLNEGDISVLSRVDVSDFLEKEAVPQVLKDYKKFERDLRNELVLIRKAWKSGREYKISRFLSDVIGQGGNPLEEEEKLLHLRWEFIEEKEEGHYSDLTFLILYFLKLQILERLGVFDKERGMMVFDELCEVKLCLLSRTNCTVH